MPSEGNIVIRKARVNNLKDITVEIPRNRLVVVTGISGSGKSSLAFDTLFAEGQRRFAESLSSYARQFLGRMVKPDVEAIDGIPPAIAIEQKVNIRNPRSTVATTTEIYDYLRLLFARIGRTYSPVSGEEVRADGVKDVLDVLCDGNPHAAYVLAEAHWADRQDKVEYLLALKEEGYSRMFNLASAEIMDIDDVLRLDGNYPTELYLLVDRVRIQGTPDEDLLTRLHSSVQAAFDMGGGDMYLYEISPRAPLGRNDNSSVIPSEVEESHLRHFCSRFERDGIVFRKPDEYLFSFNSPLGACPVCGGLGKIVGVSEDLVVPDKTKSIYDGASACWRGDKMGWFKDQLIKNAERLGIPIFEPYCKLTAEQKNIIWTHRGDYEDPDAFCGIDQFFEWVESNRYKIQYKYMLSRYSGRTTCHACGGSRLRKEALYVRVGGKTIHELMTMTVEELLRWIDFSTRPSALVEMTKSSVISSEVEKSLTLQYLYGLRKPYVREKYPWRYSITVKGAMQNNLKDIDVQFPLNAFTVVSGVSGSGKSSLVGDILYPALHRRLNETGDLPGTFKGLEGDLSRIGRVEYVDQNPIGKSSRSNAVTYLKVYDDIRKLLAEQQFARINGFTPSYFSFNQEGGRCPECQGDGVVKIGMQFMADVTMVCDSSGGKRFKPEILEVRYQGLNVDDILNMSVDQAIEFFGAQKEDLAKEIARKLQPLVDVGLGYIKLGQSSSTLSGGESQRIKLAYFLSLSDGGPKRESIMFIFDEPTTGLHFYDVEKLLKAFDVLISKGHTVIVVEHNLDVIRSADWVIDLGPDAGDRGGEVVFAGTPENLKAYGKTFTAKYL